jgi:archaellum component FlaF (FlaF/FlaG flagellin family)
MNTFKTCVKISLIVMLLLTASEPARAQPEVNIERVSEAPGGLQSNNESGSPAISSNGRYVAFKSYASNLVPNDTNRDADIFVHDQQTGTIERVSVASDGTQANGESVEPAISADGRFVAFKSAASNLVSGDTNGYSDIFIHDRQTGITERVSVTYTGTQANLFSYDAAVSNDGRYVAFTSSASNLVPGDTNGVEDVFIHDRQTDETERVSVASDGSQGNTWSNSPAITGDGRYMAFSSHASNLVIGDTNNAWDIFVHDRQTGTTERVSIASDGTQANSEADGPAITPDGRYVTFRSYASNLVIGDTNNAWDIFIHDRQTGETERVSIASDGTQANGRSYSAAISDDGRYLTFPSNASNLVPNDTNEKRDIFLHDRQTGTTERISIAADYSQANYGSYSAAISAEGRFVVFSSEASNLVPGDTNGYGDIFIRDRWMSYFLFLPLTAK